MPGSPATSPRFGAPRYDDGDAASFSAQLNSVTDVFDAQSVLMSDSRLSDQRTPLDNSVSTAKLQNGSVTTAKLQDPTTVFQPGDLIPSAAASRTGALLCNGAAVSRTTYAALFAAIGTAYGTGDGSTTFNVPDLRGCGLIGAGTRPGLTNRVRGQFLGEETHSLSAAEMAPHGHGIFDPGHSHAVADGGHSHGISDPGHTHFTGFNKLAAGGGTQAVVDSANTFSISTQRAVTGISVGVNGANISLGTSGTGIGILSAGSGFGHNNIQPSVVGNWWIKT